VKLLLEENLSAHLVELLAEVYPGSASVLSLGLGGVSDDLVWDYAKQHEFTIVSKDSDFFDRSTVSGAPPKVIWVRLGNCSTREMERVLRSKAQAVRRFIEDGQETCLRLGR
jgi:predicted nuclease of predicted toxin-antitoxin system